MTNKPTSELKFKTVIDKNTFYFFNPSFEEKYEGYLNSLKEILLFLKNEIENRIDMNLFDEQIEKEIKDKEKLKQFIKQSEAKQ
mgnify:CR=1 FL=1